MTAEQDIILYAMRDNTLDVVMQTNAGNPVDLTGYKLIMTVKVHQTDADSAALYQSAPTYTNLPFGRFSFLIPLSETSETDWAATTSGVYDVTAVTTDNYMVTLLGGIVSIVQPVTYGFPGQAILQSLSPATIGATGPAFTLLANGTGFTSGAIIVFGSVAQTTTFVSSSQLSASITRAGYTSGETMNVWIQNPDQSVTESLVFTFT